MARMTEERLEHLRVNYAANIESRNFSWLDQGGLELCAEIDRLRAVVKSARETMKLYGSIEFYNDKADYRAEAHQWLAENQEGK